MADIYAQARALVKAVRESPDWLRMRKLAGPVRADPAGEALLVQFRTLQFELQALALQGQQPDPQRQAAYQQVLQQMQANQGVLQYMQAEQAYGEMLGEVQKVLAEVFQPEVPGALRPR